MFWVDSFRLKWFFLVYYGKFMVVFIFFIYEKRRRLMVYGFLMMVYVGFVLWWCFKFISRFLGLMFWWMMCRLWRYLRVCSRLLIMLLVFFFVYLVDRVMLLNRFFFCNIYICVKLGLICIKNFFVEVIIDLDNWKKLVMNLLF